MPQCVFDRMNVQSDERLANQISCFFLAGELNVVAQILASDEDSITLLIVTC